jgi:threonine/homoserine/homoserine lactone efflux protein
VPPASNVIAFVLAAALIIAVPGPSVLFVIGRSLVHGRAGGLLSVLGNTLGVSLQVAAVALGLGAVVAQSVAVFTLVKLAGAGYLVYLGVQTIRHRADGLVDPAAIRHRSTRRLLAESFAVGVSNPKSVVFFVAALPQFVDYSHGSVQAQMAVLGAIFLGMALVSDSVWAVAAGTARNWFGRSPRRIARMRATGGVMMIGLGGVLAFTSHTS